MLSCNTGEGHNSTARAIIEVLEKRDIQCEIRDVLSCLSPRFSKFICGWHSRLYKYVPKLTAVSYRAFERNMDRDETTPVYEFLSLGANKVWKMLTIGNYDAVICVHVFSGMLMTEVRRAWGCTIPCYFVATDYTCSPMVEQCDMDGYFIPDAALSDEFIHAGIPDARLIPSGIPVRQEFYARQTQMAARKCTALPETGTVVLLMGGSMGCGPMRKIARDLTQRLPWDCTLVVFCGNNTKLLEDLSALTAPNLRALGYSREIPLYMDAADVVITKPGGLSTTEAAAKHLPMVLIDVVGGCEGKNFDFFLRRGYAVGSDNAETVVAQTLQLVEEPARRAQIRNALEQGFCGNAAERIAATVLPAAKGNAG